MQSSILFFPVHSPEETPIPSVTDLDEFFVLKFKFNRWDSPEFAVHYKTVAEVRELAESILMACNVVEAGDKFQALAAYAEDHADTIREYVERKPLCEKCDDIATATTFAGRHMCRKHFDEISDETAAERLTAHATLVRSSTEATDGPV